MLCALAALEADGLCIDCMTQEAVHLCLTALCAEPSCAAPLQRVHVPPALAWSHAAAAAVARVGDVNAFLVRAPAASVRSSSSLLGDTSGVQARAAANADAQLQRALRSQCTELLGALAPASWSSAASSRLDASDAAPAAAVEVGDLALALLHRYTHVSDAHAHGGAEPDAATVYASAAAAASAAANEALLTKHVADTCAAATHWADGGANLLLCAAAHDAAHSAVAGSSSARAAAAATARACVTLSVLEDLTFANLPWCCSFANTLVRLRAQAPFDSAHQGKPTRSCIHMLLDVVRACVVALRTGATADVCATGAASAAARMLDHAQ
ncbi:hypothetical protein EON68_04870, partial [archaeon]